MDGLTPEQSHALKCACEKKDSIFITGAAGTGKSALLLRIIADLESTYSKEEVAVTAPHGNAAINIDGKTLASAAGYGAMSKRQYITSLAFERILANPRAVERWIKWKVLVIDEVSTLDGDLFDTLELIARIIRGSDAPFGGIQLVVSGDFFQLPPVGTSYTWAFEAKYMAHIQID